MQGFLIIGCDGLWDVVTDEEAVEVVKPHIKNPLKASVLLRDYAYLHGSGDDILVVVAAFPALHMRALPLSASSGDHPL